MTVIVAKMQGVLIKVVMKFIKVPMVVVVPVLLLLEREVRCWFIVIRGSQDVPLSAALT